MANGSLLGSPWLSNIIDKHGVSTLFALAMFFVFTGHIPSPLLTAAKEVGENKESIARASDAIARHSKDQKKSFDKLLRLSLAECINAANENKDLFAAEICISSLDETGEHQKSLIRRSFEKVKQ